MFRGWERALLELGYVEGQNLVFERRYAEGKPERLPALAAELVRLKVNVIVATAGDAILAAKNATTTIPVVMAYGPDPVGRGYVASLGRPGGNVTGVAYAAEGILLPKRFELLKEAVPTARRVGMVDDGSPSFQLVLKEAQAVARTLDVQLLVVDARPGRYEQAFADLKAQRADALYAGGSPVHNHDRKQLIALAARHRLPTVWEWRQHTEEGGLLSYGANNVSLDARVAVYVDRLLKGANPAELPVEQSTKFELVINLKTAKTLGLTIPQSLLLRADQVIQ
jgi:putative ABC transport system substrate-binding protein